MEPNSLKQLDPDLDAQTVEQLKQLIKTEQADNEDDGDDDYYVFVIDESTAKVKEEIKGTLLSDYGFKDNSLSDVIENKFNNNNIHDFTNSLDSYLASNPRISNTVPETILQNQEDSADENNDATLETTDYNSENINYIQTLPIELKSLPEDNVLKILTTDVDGTIILNTQSIEDNIQFDNQDQIILCEGDDATQFRVLKCNPSELIIQYDSNDGFQETNGVFLCDCGRQFQTLAEYEKHQYSHHPAEQYICKTCGKGYETYEMLGGHMLLHDVSSPVLDCLFCNKKVKRSVLTQHIKYNHMGTRPHCEICLKTFASPNNLKRHQMIHDGIKEYQCDICMKRFHQKVTLQTHKLTHINPLVCKECGNVFNSTEEVQDHIESNLCSKSKTIKVKEALINNMTKDLTYLEDTLSTHYSCSLCKKVFTLQSELEEHLDSTHEADLPDLLCTECGEVLPTKRDMHSHKLTHKTYKMKRVKRFDCSMCGKGCTSQAMLTMHERVHTNERPFPCQLCSLRFKTKTHLRTHLLTHTKEKKFGCTICMKFFALKGNLAVHLRTHTGERPYVCDVCNEGFIDSKCLKKHKLRRHENHDETL